MYMINEKKSFDDILLLLSSEEALELQGAIEQLLMSNDVHHLHINSSDYQKEITVSILDKNSIESYHVDIRAIIHSSTIV